MAVIDTLKTSGALPINELNLLSRGSATDLHGELSLLLDRNLIAVQDGALPKVEDIPSSTVTVSLTRAGVKQAIY